MIGTYMHMNHLQMMKFTANDGIHWYSNGVFIGKTLSDATNNGRWVGNSNWNTNRGTLDSVNIGGYLHPSPLWSGPGASGGVGVKFLFNYYYSAAFSLDKIHSSPVFYFTP